MATGRRCHGSDQECVEEAAVRAERGVVPPLNLYKDITFQEKAMSEPIILTRFDPTNFLVVPERRFSDLKIGDRAPHPIPFPYFSELIGT